MRIAVLKRRKAAESQLLDGQLLSYPVLSSIVKLTRRPAFKSIIDHMSYSDSNVTECVSCDIAPCPAGFGLTGSPSQHLTRAENVSPISVRGYRDDTVNVEC